MNRGLFILSVAFLVSACGGGSGSSGPTDNPRDFNLKPSVSTALSPAQLAMLNSDLAVVSTLNATAEVLPSTNTPILSSHFTMPLGLTANPPTYSPGLREKLKNEIRTRCQISAKAPGQAIPQEPEVGKTYTTGYTAQISGPDCVLSYQASGTVNTTITSMNREQQQATINFSVSGKDEAYFKREPDIATYGFRNLTSSLSGTVSSSISGKSSSTFSSTAATREVILANNQTVSLTNTSRSLLEGPDAKGNMNVTNVTYYKISTPQYMAELAVKAEVKAGVAKIEGFLNSKPLTESEISSYLSKITSSNSQSSQLR